MPNNPNNPNPQKPQQQTQGDTQKSGQNAPGRQQDVGSKDQKGSRMPEDDLRNPQQGRSDRDDNNDRDSGKSNR